MRFALINPNWSFEGSIYFGCREPHLPVEFGYAKAILEGRGHEVLLIDAHLENLPLSRIKTGLETFRPDITVLTTAPGYLFWRCPPPELRVPIQAASAIAGISGTLVLVGPHPSATPHAALKKTGADIAIRGEFETLLPVLAEVSTTEWKKIPSLVIAGDGMFDSGIPHACDLNELPVLLWPSGLIELHGHHHHRFDSQPKGPGAEVESSRGCPFRCTFCSKEFFRDRYRKRSLAIVTEELSALRSQGVEYIYFIDEIFLPDKGLLSRIRSLGLKFGIQTRIDLWDREMLELAGAAGCVSVEAGIESISEEGRAQLGKTSTVTLAQMTEMLIFAKRHIPFVQANLIMSERDSPEEIANWRADLLAHGVWANNPVPVFPYPGSPIYRSRWGNPDDYAWERAHEHYLNAWSDFSDIQDQNPLPLCVLESGK